MTVVSRPKEDKRNPVTGSGFSVASVTVGGLRDGVEWANSLRLVRSGLGAQRKRKRPSDGVGWPRSLRLERSGLVAQENARDPMTGSGDLGVSGSI